MKLFQSPPRAALVSSSSTLCADEGEPATSTESGADTVIMISEAPATAGSSTNGVLDIGFPSRALA
jgi:hypothetical protein